MLSKKIGVVTIGQMPRPDILSLIREILGPDYEVMLVGALDDLNLEDIPEFGPEEYLLITDMRDSVGRRIELSVTREFLTPLIQQHIFKLEKEVDMIIVWCAGRFPEFKSKAIVIRPSEILKGVVNAILKKGRLGVIYPSKVQLKWAKPEWSREDIEIYADALGNSLSREEELEMLSRRLAERDLDLILLNCTGFGYKIKKLINKKIAKPVIQANALTLRVLKELLNE